MELNLDSFLDSQNISDDDDDDLRSLPHRTIDEILNDCDDSSTSSSSTPSSPSNSIQNRSFSDLLPTSQSSKDSVSALPSKPTSQTLLGYGTKSEQTLQPTLFDDKLAHSKPTSFSRAKPSESANDPFCRRPFGSLLSGVRSNVKPGEALAAAAAASRSMPTPHAAAIKSRRTVSGNLQIVAGGSELFSVNYDESDNASSGDSIGVDIKLGKSGEKFNVEEREFHQSESGVIVDVIDGIEGKDQNLGSSRDSGEHLLSGDSETREKHTTEIVNSNVNNSAHGNSNSTISNSIVKVVSQDDSSFLNVEEDMNLDNNSAASGSNGVEDQDENELLCPANEVDSRINMGSAMFNANDSSEKVGLSFPEEEQPTAGLDRQDVKSSDYFLEDPINDLSVGDNDNDGNSCMNDITLLQELGQLESKKAKGTEQMKSQKPLELAEELEKKQAYTGLHWEEGAAAQPMRLEGVGSGSTTLGYFNIDADNVVTQAISSQGFRREHGSPQVVAVHTSYIAVGMARGIIVVLPSKYSPYHADNMDGKMVLLGLQGDRLLAPVTSMCFNQQGDLLLAGYSDGHVTLWDVQRASVAKLVTGEHSAPVVHTLFLGQDSMNTRQFKAVTGDSKGVVLLLTISVVPLLNRFTIKTQCLLDGQKTGIVLSASPLLDESSGSTSLNSQGNHIVSTSGIGSMMGGVVGSDASWKLFNEGSSMVEEGVVVFVTHQTALVVRLSPKLEIYAQISKPDGIREGAMPYTAWKSATNLRGSHSENIPAEAAERVSLLALAWDNNVQVATFVKPGLSVKPELKVSAKWSLDSAVIGLAWLDDQMLVVLTSSGQLYLCTRDGSVIHQTSFTVDCFGVDDIVAYHPHFINQFGNPEKAHHNSIAVRGASIYILAPTHVLVARLLPWKERIHVLRKAGDWEGALNMSMTLYDGQACGVIDLPRGIDAVHEAIMPYLEELILSYVDEVFSYISVAFCNQMGKVDHVDDSNGSSSVHAEIKEQYNRVGGVAVEFCVHVKRTDILFDEIFSKFVRVQQRDVFLELLEPYILKDLLGCLPPEIMQALVEHYSTKGWLQRVEQCVLHMDISSLDFNQVVRLCREHGLYGALVYLFNKGLDDYRAPLEELLAVLRSSGRETSTALGYRILVYLKYCFSGLAFPPGHGIISPTRLSSLRKELLQFLLEDCGSLSPRANSSLTSRGTYPNLYYLLGIDTEATLTVLRYALAEDENPNMNTSSNGQMNGNMDEKKSFDEITRTQNVLLQKMVDALAFVLDKGIRHKDLDIDGDVEEWPSMEDIGYLFEFIAYYVSLRRCKVSKGVLSQILEFLISDSNFRSSVSENSLTPNRREKQVLGLLIALPESEWNASYILGLCEKAQFYQVCGLIHTLRNKHLDALDSYMKDVEEPIHAFSFINKTLYDLTGNDCVAFRLAVISRIPQLVDLSREATFFLILSHFNDENSDILTELKSHPRSLFLYLKTLIEVYLSGNLNFPTIRKDDGNDHPQVNLIKDLPHGLFSYMESLSNFPNFLLDNPIHVTDDVIELYLELLCQFERESVLKFLETFDSYRMEHCLRLCQEYGIVDAAAFLLERVGDVGSALLLTLSCLNDKFTELDVAVEAIVSRDSSFTSFNRIVYSSVVKTKEVNDINNIIHSCILICQRNTPRLNPEEAETYWFKLLDSFCEPLMDSHNASEGEVYFRMPNMSVNSLENNEEGKIKWRISKTNRGLHILRKLFSQFIKEIVEAMIGYVRLPTIMSKLLTDNGSQEFGDFKLTILGMLGTYGFERRILDTAKSLIEDDTFYTMNVLKRGASHGYAPRSFTCCICNSLLSKNSSSGIRVFSCGHASHLHCEVMENVSSSQGSAAECPVCMPKRKTQQSRNKLVLAEDSLVSKLSRRRQDHGNNKHLHESDLAENAYSPQLMSRFEILSKLHKNQSLIQIESIPQLRLAPPAVYHEKVNRVADFQTGESSTNTAHGGKSSKHRQERDLRSKGSSLRFPLRSSIFGKEKLSKQ